MESNVEDVNKVVVMGNDRLKQNKRLKYAIEKKNGGGRKDGDIDAQVRITLLEELHKMNSKFSKLHDEKQWIEDTVLDVWKLRKYDDELYYWNGDAKKWKRAEEMLMAEIGRDVFLSPSVKREIIEDVKTKVKVIEREAEGIALANGYYIDADGSVKDMAADVFIIHTIEAGYNLNARADEWMRFLARILPDEADRIKIQEFMGYTLTSGYKIKKSLLMIGAGNNGKTTLSNAIVNILGQENVSGISIEELFSGQFAVSDLYGKMMNIDEDVKGRVLEDVGVFKRLTGNSVLTADRKYKERITFYNRAKLVFTANTLPYVKKVDDAFFDRLVVVKFNVSIPREGQDSELGQKLASERDGIFLWMLEGLRRVVKNGFKFTYNDMPQDVRDEWIRHSDNVEAFVKECVEITEDDDDSIVFRELYEEYKKFCKKYGIQSSMLSEGWFSKRFKELTGAVNDKTGGKRGFKNVKLRGVVDNE